MRSLVSVLIALALALGVSSCASTSRLWRMSPMGSDATEDRVNLWPIVHSSGSGTAVVWPFFDVDDKGFALRPLIAKDGPRWEVLYPLAAHNTSTGNGWAVPFYWIGDSKGLFPIMHFGAFSFVGPFFWKRSAGETDYVGLFPLAFLGELSFVGPVWWMPGDPHVDGGLFPIAQFGDFSYVGPVWWERKSRDFGVFPLFGVGSTRHIGPVWWRNSAKGREGWGLFPLLWSLSAGEEFAFLPFYSHNLREASRTRNYLLGLGHTHASATERRNWLLPFYYEHERGEDEDSALLPFYWKRKRGAETQVFTLLGNRRVEDDGGSFNVYPLWWSSRTADSATRMLLPFFYYEEDRDERTFLSPLGGRGWSASGATRYVNVLGPIYHHSESVDGLTERTAVLWPFFEREREGNVTTTRSIPFFSHQSDGERAEGWYGLGLGHYVEAPDESGHRLWPLYSVSHQKETPGPLYNFTLWGSRWYEETSKHWLFPLFSAESSAHHTEVSGLVGVFHYAHRDQSTSWRVWPLASVSRSDEDPALLHWLTLLGSAETPGYESQHVFTPFVFVRTERETNTRRSNSSYWFSLFNVESSETIGSVIPRDRTTRSEHLVARSSQSFLFGLFANVHEEFRRWREGAVTDAEAAVLANYSTRFDGLAHVVRDDQQARRILAARGRAPQGLEEASLRANIESFVADHTEIVERRRVRLPLLWNYERTGDDVEWSGPLWLVNSSSKPGRSKFNVLFYGYRSETIGEQTRRDIFPFITWDSAPTASKVSFLWRVFRYETKGDKSGGHFLFIPWGDL